jgi:hypothetical protein
MMLPLLRPVASTAVLPVVSFRRQYETGLSRNTVCPYVGATEASATLGWRTLSELWGARSVAGITMNRAAGARRRPKCE